MKYVYALLALLVLAGALEWHGHSRGFDAGVLSVQQDAIKKIAKANGERDQAVAERDATAQSLANVQRTLQAQRERLELANFFAKAAMDERASLQRQLTKTQHARTQALRTAAHESPACADLARLPVCPAVADRLWGKTAGDPAGSDH